MACAKDRADSAYRSHGLDFASKAAPVRTVYRAGSSAGFTSFQCTGMEIGAPARAREDSTATAVAVRSFRR
jgi:hypothetical protein